MRYFRGKHSKVSWPQYNLIFWSFFPPEKVSAIRGNKCSSAAADFACAKVLHACEFVFMTRSHTTTSLCNYRFVLFFYCILCQDHWQWPFETQFWFASQSRSAAGFGQSQFSQIVWIGALGIRGWRQNPRKCTIEGKIGS